MALIARVSGPTRACRPTWAGKREKGPVSKFIPHLTSPNGPQANSLLLFLSKSSHAGHTQ